MKKLLAIILSSVFILWALPCMAAEAHGGEEEGKVDAKEIIFEHLGDRYGWEVPFCHDKSIPLPIILWGHDGLHCFMSSKVEHGRTYVDGDATFRVAGADSEHKGKIVEIIDGKEYRPWDISITKNVLGLFIAVVLVIWSILDVLMAQAQWIQGSSEVYRRYRDSDHVCLRRCHTTDAQGSGYEVRTISVDGVLLHTIYESSGLIVVFPGGANLTGNIAVTLVLSVFTFLLTNVIGTKHYWKEIFWLDVPLWLKFPLPIMPVIEIFGALTKPAALTVRLFANMLGGHMIILVLTLLIFIFAAMTGSGRRHDSDFGRLLGVHASD